MTQGTSGQFGTSSGQITKGQKDYNFPNQNSRSNNVHSEELKNIDSLTPEQKQVLKDELTPQQLEEAERDLSPAELERIKPLLGLEPGDLPTVPPHEILEWAQKLRDDGVNLDQLSKETKEQIISWLHQRQMTQRVVDVTNPPYLLLPGGPKPIEGIAYAVGKEFVLPAAVSKAAESVGRIEDVSGNLVGTAWVIKNGVIATNCHVALQLLGAGAGAIPAHTSIVFEGSDVANKSQKFQVSSILFLSKIKGLDIALLAVNKASEGSHLPLPPALNLRGVDALPLGAYFVGYASGTQRSSSFDTDQLMHALSHLGKSAKISSPVDLSALISFDGFAVLLHNASTHYGSSGSPLLDPAGQVVAVHDCCNVASDFIGGQTCASTTVVTPFNNQAIASGVFDSIPELKKALQ